MADKDAFGTCPRMIRSGHGRASGFPAGPFRKKATNPPRTRVAKVMRTILLIVLILLLIGSLPAIGVAPDGWGYYPGGGLLVVIILLLIFWRG